MLRAKTERQRKGSAAEDAALAHLQLQGMHLLERNALFPFGEIDLVMRQGPTLAFVEVRFRKSAAFGGGAVSVTLAKRRRIVLAAQAWLIDNPTLSRAPCRFDVVAVSPAADALVCDWIPAAFTLDDIA